MALLEDMRPAAFLLLGAVALVLLIACANLAHLFLARSTTRQRELAVRLALGAGRWRLARHVLTETVLIALAGGAVGVALAAVGMRGATALLPAQLQMLDLHAAIDTRVLLWSLGLTVATGLLVGVVPAFQATRTDPHESLKVDGRGGAGSRWRTAAQRAGGREVALSVVLLLGAGLLMRTFINIQRVEPGFEPRGVLTMRLTLPRDRYPGRSGQRVLRRAARAAVGAAAGARRVGRVAVSADGGVRHPVRRRATARRQRGRHSDRVGDGDHAAVFRGAARADAERPELRRHGLARRAARARS